MKNKGVIISICLILVVGALITFGTRRFVSDGKRQTAADGKVYKGSLFSEGRSGTEQAMPGGAQTDSPPQDSAEAHDVSGAAGGSGKEPPEMQREQEEARKQSGEGSGAGEAPEEAGIYAAGEVSGSGSAGEAPAPAAESTGLEDMAGAAEAGPAGDGGSAGAGAGSVVISPLTGAAQNAEEAGSALTEEDYRRRLEEVDGRILKMKESGVMPSTDSCKNMAEYEYRLWDTELNAIYKDILKGMAEEETDALRREEREWMKFRDETARKATAKYNGGSIETMEYTASLAVSTRARAYELLDNYGEYLPDEDEG